MSAPQYSFHHEVKWEPRPCATCGFKRKRVRITRWPGSLVATERERQWEPNCSACQADAAAQRHRYDAQKWAKRAEAIRAKRGGE